MMCSQVREVSISVDNSHCATSFDFLLHKSGNWGRDDNVVFCLQDDAWNVDFFENLSLIYIEHSPGQGCCNFRPHLFQAFLKPTQWLRIGFVHNKTRKVCGPIFIVGFNICYNLIDVWFVETTFIVFCIYIPNNTIVCVSNDTSLMNTSILIHMELRFC